MATSGSFNTSAYVSSSLSPRYYTFSWSLSGQSISENYSDISWSLKGAGGSNNNYWVNVKQKYVTVNGTKKSNETLQKTYNGTVAFSGTTRIYHNADGTKSFTVSAGGAFEYYGSYNSTGSKTFELPTIPRASTVSGGSGNIGSATTINISRASSSFTHTLKYAFGSLTGTIATGVGTSYNWTIPTSFYSQIPNSNTGTGSITCETYSGSTLIGTKSISFTAKVTNSNPTFTASNVTYADTNTTVTAITGNNQHIVQNKSNLKVTYSQATARNSATIKSYSFTLNGVTKSSTSAGGTIDFGVINSSSNLTLTVKVTDSRGNATSVTKTITMLAHSNPSAIVTLNRLNNYEDTTYLKVDGSIASVNSKNKMTIQYRYKISGGSYNSFATISDNTQVTLSLNKNNSYIFNIVVTDSFGATYNKEHTLGKGVFPLFIDTGKNSVGVNCFPTITNGFEVDGTLKHNNIYVHNASSGQGSTGYIKFAEITINYSYINQPIEFKIGRRQSYLYTTVSMMFASTDSLDPNLQGFETRWWNIPIYAVKTSASNWSLYIQKAEAYDYITIANVTKGWYLRNVSIKFTDEFVATLPSGTVQAQYYQVPMHKTLYENATGTTGTITLKDSVANYTYLEIYYMDNLKADVQSIKVPSPNNKIVTCACIEPSESERVYIRATRYTLVGTAMTYVRGLIGTLQNSSDPTVTMTPYIYVIKVVGYR